MLSELLQKPFLHWQSLSKPGWGWKCDIERNGNFLKSYPFFKELPEQGNNAKIKWTSFKQRAQGIPEKGGAAETSRTPPLTSTSAYIIVVSNLFLPRVCKFKLQYVCNKFVIAAAIWFLLEQYFFCVFCIRSLKGSFLFRCWRFPHTGIRTAGW